MDGLRALVIAVALALASSVEQKQSRHWQFDLAESAPIRSGSVTDSTLTLTGCKGLETTLRNICKDAGSLLVSARINYWSILVRAS